MFQAVVGLVLLVVISLAGRRKIFVRLPLSLGTKFFFLTGTEFIFIGLALGDRFIGLLDRQTITHLGPLLILGLGYFGLVFGLQFEYEKVRRFPLHFLSATVIQAAITFLLVFTPFVWLLNQLAPGLPSVILALAVGAVACCTSPTMIALIVKELRPPRTGEIDLIRYIGAFDTIIGFTLFGVAACLLHTTAPPLGIDFSPALQWIVASIVFGASMGFLLHLLTQVHCMEDELWVFTIGIITFTGGVSQFFGLSPLFVNMVAGITAANLPGSKDRVFMAIARQEKTFYIGFLILAGALWRPEALVSVGLAAAYLTFRMVGKVLGGYAAARFVSAELTISPMIGFGLLSQSGVAIAMAMDLYLSGSGAMTDLIMAMLVIAVIVNELVSPAMTNRLLLKSGEKNP